MSSCTLLQSRVFMNLWNTQHSDETRSIRPVWWKESCLQKSSVMRCKYSPCLMFLNKFKCLKQKKNIKEGQRRKALVKSLSFFSEVLVPLLQAQFYRITYISVDVMCVSLFVYICKYVKMLLYHCWILLAQKRTSTVSIQKVCKLLWFLSVPVHKSHVSEGETQQERNYWNLELWAASCWLSNFQHVLF